MDPVDTTNMDATERMFYDEMAKIGASLEGFIRRSPRDWYPDKRAYKITRSDGSIRVGEVNVDLETYQNILNVAKGA
jgi:hypothetical protein